MKKMKLRLVLLGLIILIHSCTSDKKAIDDDEFGTDSTEVAETTDPSGVDPDLALDDTTRPTVKPDDAAASTAGDEFAEFDKATSPDATPEQTASNEDTLEKELNSLDEAPPAAPAIAANEAPAIPVEKSTQTEGELTLEDEPAASPADMSKTATPEVAVTNPEETLDLPDEPAIPSPIVQVPEINPQVSPTIEQPPVPMAPKISEINSVQYQSNQAGGTVVINSNEPLQFTTRSNPATHQMIIEVQNSVIPKKLKRSLNTKDMASSIGSVDIYQKPNSNVARFVVQLRPGSPEPLVQPEGNSLLLVGAANPTYVKNTPMDASQTGGDEASSPVHASIDGSGAIQGGGSVVHSSQDVNPDLTSEGIMNSQSLEDFLASNNKFYGKKISIEAVKLNVNDAFKFLAEESGVNMIIDDGVSGDVTLKLRQVPWDQAFVLILKSKKLGYKRQGNVIRIADIASLQKEEDDAIKLSESRKNVQPLVVKRFFIGYAEIGEMEKKIKDFISTTQLTATGAIATSLSRGKVISDARTSSLIVTETAENLIKIEKLVAALDTQPKQVLIEGKVVEAKETYSHSLGVKWNTEALPATSGNSIRPTVDFNPGKLAGTFNPTVGIGIPGQPGDFGNLNASLSLGESENKLRVLSSPRISVLSSQSATIAQTVNVLIDKGSTTGAGTGVISSTKEAVAVGVTLTVTPQVSNEGTVVMDLSIERSFLATAGGSDIEKRNAKTKVIVRSGQTAVIGGIFQADSAEDVSGIPFFKDIPIFGVLFKSTQKSRTKNELVIFVTPRILKTVQGDTSSVTKFE